MMSARDTKVVACWFEPRTSAAGCFALVLTHVRHVAEPI